jgi:DNA-binding NarL/FixJ family response regulator
MGDQGDDQGFGSTDNHSVGVGSTDNHSVGVGSTDNHSVGVGSAAARVLIAAATTLFRDGVLAALRDDDRFLVVGSAQDAREFVWRAVAERPDVALLDVELLRAAAAQGLLLQHRNGPRLVVLAVSDSEDEMSACAAAGATEIVRRRAGREELLSTLARAMEGDSRVSSLQAALVSEQPEEPASAVEHGSSPEHGSPAGQPPLTPREREILIMIEAGSTNKAIALELGCSHSTVKNHVHSVLAKLGVSRRTEAARFARDLTGSGGVPRR